MVDCLKRFFVAMLRCFFMGPIYPIIVCLIVFLGYVYEIEFYLNVINVLLAVVMLSVCDSLRPFIVVVASYVYQISVAHSPSFPANSDYLITPPGLYLTVSLFVLAGIALIRFFIRNNLISLQILKSLPMLPAFFMLSFAFLVNGAFSGAWNMASLAYGLLNILAFFGIFYIFYLGFRNERAVPLLKYLSYVSALMALVLISEVIWVYKFGGVFDQGSVLKSKILFGWGNWNTMGQNLTVLIPVIFYGAMKNKCPWFYFGVATATLVAAILTLSRNALIFATLSYAVCVVIACFFGNNQKAFRVILPTGVAGIAVGVVVFWEKLSVTFADFLDRGLSDNGRFDLYHRGIAEFLEAPLFGKGFFGIDTDIANFVDFFPDMMHNTPVQLLASMGIVGFIAYLYYRYRTVKLVLKRPSLEKTMIAMSLFVLALQSLLDNFIFYVQPMIYYSIALAVCVKLDESPTSVSTYGKQIKNFRENY